MSIALPKLLLSVVSLPCGLIIALAIENHVSILLGGLALGSTVLQSAFPHSD
ncbi:hypothetical protein NIES2104_55430 [Leptolyngbya sp. NIES-2104]|nr:hypothetical protein NIES2104_55430 [Leptolyngbya sp. NIES-2104]